MGACNRQHPLVIENMLADPLRARGVRQTAIKDFFHQGIAARDDVANHEKVGFQIDLLRPKALDQLDALRFELGAHWRINIGIAAGNFVSGLFGQHGEPTHKGAANTQDMNIHCRILGVVG